MAKSNHRSVDRVERGRRLERVMQLQEMSSQDFRRQARVGWQEEQQWEDEGEDQEGDEDQQQYK